MTINTQLSTINFFVCACFAGLIPVPRLAVAEEIVPSVQANKLPGQDAQPTSEKSLVEALQAKKYWKKAAIFKKVSAPAAPAAGEAEKKEKGKFLSALLKKKDQTEPESGPVEEKATSPEKNQTVLAEATRISGKNEDETKASFIELVPPLKPVNLKELEQLAQSPTSKAKQEKPTAEFLDLPTL